jgi:Flp pilus assembly protein TadD/cytochrome c553
MNRKIFYLHAFAIAKMYMYVNAISITYKKLSIFTRYANEKEICANILEQRKIFHSREYFTARLTYWFVVCAFLALFTTTSTAATYVGGQTCGSCHEAEFNAWQNSHHDLAMQPANEKTVLGDFQNTSFSHFGVTSSFYKKDGKFMVRTNGGDGKLQEYEIKYTFGVEPLQQYLIEFPGGRMQVFSVAWDARSSQQGGQRWFHVLPNEKIAHNDVLHWTKPSQNWNSRCAECHSTNLEKKYDSITKTFSTTWSEINVSCESCHGPGSNHVGWAKREPGWEKFKNSLGLKTQFDERKGVQWTIDSHTGNSTRSKTLSSAKEIEVCARCHSRRSQISNDYVHGESLLDHYLPALLRDGTYFSDGQIDDEVFVYGSFIQSKMYKAGVTCSDCHEPHNLALKLPGNGVCSQCHAAAKYDQASHHFHEENSKGASCAECHMPPRTYMVVDPRHDHSMRVPRPDLSVKLGTPNACNNCHQDKDAKWSAEQVDTWYGDKRKGFQTYAHTFHNARNDETGAGSQLASLIRDAEVPNIARATALDEIGPYLGATTIDVLPLALSDDDPLVRMAATGMLDQAPSDVLRVRLAFPMLEDPVRAVRIEAARVLSTIPSGSLSTKQQAVFDKALQEYIDAQLINADRPEAQTNLGDLYASRGQEEKAIAAYKMANELSAFYMPAHINLADLYRAMGNENKAYKVLRQAAKIAPDNTSLHYALGLSLVRQNNTDKAIEELRQASVLSPNIARYSYVYGVALNSVGKKQQAIIVLKAALIQHHNNRDILTALVTFNRDMGNEAEAKAYAEKLHASGQ